jgi:integrase/recombinase XerD
LSDKKFQYCKGLPHVISKKEYAGRDYKAAKTKIMLSYEFYEELLPFIEESRETAKAKYPKNMALINADVVTGDDGPEQNFYIFLNRYGKPLSDQKWNNRLRKYFEQSGLIVDKGIKENNLSHRFRHGFAMFHARYSSRPVDALKLQKLMRHRSVTSTMVYYNPTPTDEYETKTEFLKELYEAIPDLHKGELYE